MDGQNSLFSFDILKDLFRHHRKFTAFQKTVAFSTFLGVLILIFRNVWILLLALSYGGCLYLSNIACQHIVEYRSYFPSEVVLVFLERLEKLFENADRGEPAIPKVDSIDPAIQNEESVKTDTEEFYDASDDPVLDTASQSTFYFELGDEHSFEHIEGHTSNLDNQNKESTRQKYSEYISNNCPQNVQDEIDKLIILIDRDFIKSWYYLFSKHFESLEDADDILHEIQVSLLQRILKVDIKVVAKVLMCLFSNHVKRCKEARMMYKVQSKRRRKSSAKSENVSTSPKLSPMVLKSLEECFASKVDFHTALKSNDIEYMYLNSLVELLILKLLPDHLNDSKGVVCALREILSCNVLCSVMNLICDPTFLHERIIKITSDEEPGGELVELPVLTESNTEEVSLEAEEKENSEVDIDSKECAISKVEDKNDIEVQYTAERKSSFLDDTKLHFVSRGMCNECNRLCSKDRDKIESHPHTCSLGNQPCFLDVKHHDKDRLSASSGEESPVFKFYISEIDNTEETPSQHSQIHDIPNEVEIDASPDIIPNKVILKNVPLKLEKKEPGQHVLSRSWPTESDKSLLDEPTKGEHLSQSSSLTESRNSEHLHESQPVKSDITLTQDINRSQENLPGADNGSENKSKHLKNTDEISKSEQIKQTTSNTKETQEQSFLPSFGGSLFGFTFPQFSKMPLKEKNRSSSNLEQISDSESEDLSNMRRSKSSTGFRPDDFPTETPLPFQDIRIEKTETAKEAGSLNPYTLYVIRYEAIHPTEDDIYVHRSGMVKRRFREFVNLQLRLEDNPLYKKSLKDIKGPRKWLQLPFGNMDKDSIESRRKILLTFLTALIKKEDICSGPEMKEFLGYTGDGHIAFVRKVPENVGPRIDQRLVKTMSGVFDKIVDALPSLPNELPRIIKPERPRDETETDKLVDDCDQIDLDTCFDEDERKSQRLHKTLEDFVRFESLALQHGDHEGDHTMLGTSVLEWQEVYSQSSHADGNQTNYLDLSNTQTANLNEDREPVPLCNALLDILSELLYGHDSWMCREPVMKSIRTVAGRALERYLSTKIDFLVSAEMTTFYLTTLRETVWPDNQLLTESRPNYTDRQKEGIKKQAARCLGNFLPGMSHETRKLIFDVSDQVQLELACAATEDGFRIKKKGALHTLLGEEDFDLTLEEIMESIKCEKLNRHFWYTFLDILVEHMFPEVKTEEIQRKLSRS